MGPLRASKGAGGWGRRRRWLRHGWPAVELLGAAALILGLAAVLLGGSGDRAGAPTAPTQIAGIGAATPLATVPDSGQTGQMPGPAPDGTPRRYGDGIPVGEGSPLLAIADETLVRAVWPGEGRSGTRWAVQATSLLDGTRLWDVGIEASNIQIGGMVADVAIVAVSTDGTPLTVAGTELGEAGQGFVLGLDRQTGTVRWSTPVADPLPGMIVERPTITPDGTAYVSTRQGRVVALDGRSGAVRWTAYVFSMDKGEPPATPPTDTISPVAVAGGVATVFSFQAGSLVGIDAETGESLWVSQRSEDPGLNPSPPVIFGPVMAHGLIFLTTSDWADGVGSGDQGLVAIDASTGRPIWAIDLPPVETGVGPGAGIARAGQAAVADRAVLVPINGDGDTTLMAFDPATGTPLWEIRFAGTASLPLSIVGDTAYAARADGRLTAIDLATGAGRWTITFEFVIGVDSAPYIVDGWMYVYDGISSIFRFGPPGDPAILEPATPDAVGTPIIATPVATQRDGQR